MGYRKSKFRAPLERTLADVGRLMRRIGAGDYSIQQSARNTKAGVTFDRDYTAVVGGQRRVRSVRYVVTCDEFTTLPDNLRAVYLTIDALHRAVQYWGATEEQFETVFAGAAATPEDLAPLLTAGDWWGRLGLPSDKVDRDQVERAYRIMAHHYHPDKGGTHDEWLQVQQAYRDGLAATRGRV